MKPASKTAIRVYRLGAHELGARKNASKPNLEVRLSPLIFTELTDGGALLQNQSKVLVLLALVFCQDFFQIKSSILLFCLEVRRKFVATGFAVWQKKCHRHFRRSQHTFDDKSPAKKGNVRLPAK